MAGVSGQATVSVSTETHVFRHLTKREILFYNIRRNKVAYAFLAPFAILFFIFIVLPVFVGIGLSFTSYNLVQPPKFIGFSNYWVLFTADDVFITALTNTVKFAFVTGPVSYVLAFMIAWMLQNVPNRLRWLYTLAFYGPTLAPPVAVIALWQYMFSADRYGLINTILIRLGFMNEPFAWLQDTGTIMNILIIVSLWLSMGAAFLAFLAGFKNVPEEVIEAGKVDGVRSRWQELWFITIPIMKPQLLFGAVLQIVAAFVVGDVSAWLFGLPSPQYAGHTILNHLSDYAFTRYEMGYASAIAVVLFAIMFGLNRICFRLLASRGD